MQRPPFLLAASAQASGFFFLTSRKRERAGFSRNQKPGSEITMATEDTKDTEVGRSQETGVNATTPPSCQPRAPKRAVPSMNQTRHAVSTGETGNLDDHREHRGHEGAKAETCLPAGRAEIPVALPAPE